MKGLNVPTFPNRARFRSKRQIQMTRAAVSLACIACLASWACDDSTRSPMAPTPYSEQYAGMKSALLCIQRVDSYLAVGEADLCTEDADRHLSTGCKLAYNARFRNTCSDGCPIPAFGATAARAIRVRMAVAGFRGGQRFYTAHASFDIVAQELRWLCGGDGEKPADNCVINVPPEDLRRFPIGDFEVKRRWNACWLEHRPAAGGLGCYPDPDYPEFPTSEDGPAIGGL